MGGGDHSGGTAEPLGLPWRGAARDPRGPFTELEPKGARGGALLGQSKTDPPDAPPGKRKLAFRLQVALMGHARACHRLVQFSSKAMDVSGRTTSRDTASPTRLVCQGCVACSEAGPGIAGSHFTRGWQRQQQQQHTDTAAEFGLGDPQLIQLCTSQSFLTPLQSSIYWADTGFSKGNIEWRRRRKAHSSRWGSLMLQLLPCLPWSRLTRCPGPAVLHAGPTPSPVTGLSTLGAFKTCLKKKKSGTYQRGCAKQVSQASKPGHMVQG